MKIYISKTTNDKSFKISNVSLTRPRLTSFDTFEFPNLESIEKIYILTMCGNEIDSFDCIPYREIVMASPYADFIDHVLNEVQKTILNQSFTVGEFVKYGYDEFFIQNPFAYGTEFKNFEIEVFNVSS